MCLAASLAVNDTYAQSTDVVWRMSRTPPMLQPAINGGNINASSKRPFYTSVMTNTSYSLYHLHSVFCIV